MSFAVSVLVKVTATLAAALIATRVAHRTCAAVRHVLLAAELAIAKFHRVCTRNTLRRPIPTSKKLPRQPIRPKPR